MDIFQILEILGFIVGLFYLWWEYHADPKLWIASIIMPAISMWVYLSKGLYADFSINIYYFVIAIYGYVVWTRRPSGKEGGAVKPSLPITHLRGSALWASAGCFLALWTVIWAGLHWLTNSTVPVADAFTTALSIVAMWMLARKYIEQWLAWIAVDAVCVGLYIYKGIYLYACLYLIYTVIAVLGWRKWRRLMSGSGEQKPEGLVDA